MKLTDTELKQIIKEELQKALTEASENVGSFYVISPDGKVFNIKKHSRTHGDIDPQKAINLVATVTKRGLFGDYRVYEVPQEGGPPEGEPILTGKPED